MPADRFELSNPKERFYRPHALATCINRHVGSGHGTRKLLQATIEAAIDGLDGLSNLMAFLALSGEESASLPDLRAPPLSFKLNSFV